MRDIHDLEIRPVRDPQLFASLKPAWNDLLARSAQDNPFLTHEWLYSWWEAFGTGAELLVLLFHESGTPDRELVGIFPGYVRQSGVFPPCRAWRFLGSEVVTSDFLGAIAARGREGDVYRALARYLETEWAFHYAEWTDLLAESCLVEKFGTGVPHRLNSVVWRADKFCPYLDLPESTEAYLSALSINTRKRYRYRRRLEEQGMTLEYVTDPGDLPAAIDDFARLHTERRRQKNGAGIFATAPQRQFYRSVFERFLAEGWLELVFLRVGGERVATVCQFNYGDRIYYYQTGYSTAWEHYRVGFVLISLLIEEAIRQQKKTYEFLRGREEYKYRFGATGERRLTDLIITNGTFTSAAVYRRRVWGRRLREFVGRMLPAPVKAGISRITGTG